MTDFLPKGVGVQGLAGNGPCDGEGLRQSCVGDRLAAGWGCFGSCLGGGECTRRSGFEGALMREAVDTGRSFQGAESGCRRFEVTRLLTFRVNEQSCRRATSAWTSCVSRTWAAPLFPSLSPHNLPPQAVAGKAPSSISIVPYTLSLCSASTFAGFP